MQKSSLLPKSARPKDASASHDCRINGRGGIESKLTRFASNNSNAHVDVTAGNLLLNVNYFANHLIDRVTCVLLNIELLAQQRHVNLRLRCILTRLQNLLDGS